MLSSTPLDGEFEDLSRRDVMEAEMYFEKSETDARNTIKNLLGWEERTYIREAKDRSKDKQLTSSNNELFCPLCPYQATCGLSKAELGLVISAFFDHLRGCHLAYLTRNYTYRVSRTVV